MAVRLAINGFGRIGRLVLRAIIESQRKDVEIIGINDLGSPEINGHLLKYDTVHGNLDVDVNVDGDILYLNGVPVKVTAERDPAQLPWAELNIDVALECTGFFTDRPDAAKHLKAGAKKVLISAPGNDSDKTIVFGVNHHTLDRNDSVVSNASCTAFWG